MFSIPHLLEDCPNNIERNQQHSLLCPKELQDHIVLLLDSIEKDDAVVVRLDAYLEIARFISLDKIIMEKIVQAILSLVIRKLTPDTSLDTLQLFSVGAGLDTCFRYSSMSNETARQLWPLLCSVIGTFGRMPLYLENIMFFSENYKVFLDQTTLDILVPTIVSNLVSPSSTLRTVSLRLLNVLHIKINGHGSEALLTALTIESTPLDLKSARVASMHVRRLSNQYSATSSVPWIKRAVISFCFGLLTFKLAQLWDEAVDTLKIICHERFGEEAISDIAFKLLEESSTKTVSSTSTEYHESPHVKLTEFQCSNVAQLVRNAGQQFQMLKSADEQLQYRFNSRHQLCSRISPTAVSQALRVLAGIPHVAEKYSRHLVPYFLRWAFVEREPVTNETTHSNTDHINISKTAANASQKKVSWKDGKAMLKLFGMFTNPRVLYKSSKVYEAVLHLLASGDSDIQKLALQVISTWKLDGVQPYMENLQNLLDDSRFREEVSVFLRMDDENNSIQPEHYSDIMPVLLRLLYGRLVARSGSASGGGAQATRRKAVLEALSRLPNDFIQDFLSIALGPLQSLTLTTTATGEVSGIELPSDLAIPIRKLVGVVTMIEDLLDTMGNKVTFLLQPIANAVLYCICQDPRILPESEEESPHDSLDSSQASLQKVVRHISLQCLILLFKLCPPQKMQTYVSFIFRKLLNHRLVNLPIETAQSVSGILRLFGVWASDPENAKNFLDINTTVLDTLVNCLDVPFGKDEVKLFVIDAILKPLIKHDRVGPDQKSLLVSNSTYLLQRVGSLMRKSPSKQVLDSAIELMSMIAPGVVGSSQIRSLLDVSIFLLDQPSQRVSPRSKGNLLQILQKFVPLFDLNSEPEMQDRLFRSVSSLFGYFRDRNSRTTLSAVLEVLAKQDKSLEGVSCLCTDLNSFSADKIDQPDFERRLKAFNMINEAQFLEFSTKQWYPLIYNMIFYVKDEEELAIRSSASYSLRRFIETSETTSIENALPYSGLLKEVVLPALRNGAEQHSELVRSEYLALMAHLVRFKPDWYEVNDMTPLLFEDDEEASFFGNVLHIQHHRRLRALRRLATEASAGRFRSANIAHFLMPLLEHFIFDKAEDESAHNLAAEATTTIGALAEGLEWPQLRALFRRICSYLQNKADLEKGIIRLIGILIDAMEHAGVVKQQSLVSKSADPSHDRNEAGESLVPIRLSTLVTTMPSQEKLTDDITKNLLPSLVAYLHDKDDAKVSLRVRTAVSVVKMLKLLPMPQLFALLPPILTDVCHILRSRAQESRDMTRRTLVEISALIGPQSFGFILRELRGSLARGYQLHVLSYTVHSMLVATATVFKPGDLDYCLPQIVAIIMDDIFGTTGQEKDAEEYISKMREVKSSKSFDSMELVAKTAAVDHLSHLMRPLQTLLEEKLNLKIVKKIDELLRRIGVGLLRNEAAGSREALVFCFEILQDTHKAKRNRGEKLTKEDYRVKRYLLMPHGSRNDKNKVQGTSSYTYKLARFAFDVLRSILHKYDELQTAANLFGFMPAIGDALIEAHDEVQVSALRLLATIIKVPLKDIDKNAPLYVSEAIKIIKNTTSTNTEAAQAALKLVSAVLRERREVTIREIDIAYLLKRLRPDLEEPDRQGVTFNFLKAVMARKMIMPEVYEVVDSVAAMMVTNQAQGVRDTARSVYFQFILNYPQTKDRFSKQLSFLVKNLDYEHVEGRQSVMEAIHLLLTKLNDDLIQDLLRTFFIPLLMVTINDISLDCRKMAGVLLKELFERADDKNIQNFLTLLRTWLNQDEQPLLIRVSLQTFGTYLDVHGTKGDTELSLLQSRVIQLLRHGLEDGVAADWELMYFALQLVAKLCDNFHIALLKPAAAPLWTVVIRCLNFPHAWVKLATARLLGVYFADFARQNAGLNPSELLLKGSGGLHIDNGEMVDIVKASLRTLRVPGVGEDLASQTVRNLVFLGRLMGMTGTIWPRKAQEEDVEESVDEREDENVVISQSEATKSSARKTAVEFIFERVSSILRREPLTTKAPSLIPKTAALQLVAVLCSHLPPTVLSSSIETILLPLHNLTDPSIPAPYSADEGFRTAYKSLVSTSQEIMSLLQKKIGTTEFVANLNRVREGVRQRREGRRVKRRIDIIAEPEKVGREKKRKGEKKKEKRKERSGEDRSRRRGW